MDLITIDSVENSSCIPTLLGSQNNIEKLVKEKLISRGFDVTSPSTNVSMVVDLLSYMTTLISEQESFAFSESYLPETTIRRNAIINARKLGYERHRKISYVYQLSISFLIDSNLDENDTTNRVYQIPKYSTFSSNGNYFVYLGDDIELSFSNNDITNQIPGTKQLIYVKRRGYEF